jgi:hypothetical protein
VKKGLILLSVLLLSVSLMAQVRTGTIWGHVTDTQGAPLPGVSVTLTSNISAPMTVVTDVSGIFRFPSLDPSSQYNLTAELQGFKKIEKTGIIVVIGQSSRIDLTLEQGKIEEEVTVVAITPTIDTKKTSVGKNITQEILQALPSSRDPWNVMQMAPSVMMDRENVGGSESGQQAGYYAKGDSSGGANNVWSLDGVVVTDPAAIGASPGYWDFDSFEEMNVVTGGADVTIQTGGVALNMVTRRGGNRVSLGGRFYLTDDYFQANNLTAALQAQGVPGINKIIQIKDYGFNLGGPVVKDKVWLWMSYGIQDINALTVIGTPQKPTLSNYNFKLNLQLIPSNRFEALYTAGDKKFIGRSSSQNFPEGYDQSSPYHWGTPIIKLQDEQMVGNNLLLSAKFGYMNASFQLIPHSDPDSVNLVTHDATASVWHDWDYYITTRPMYDYDFHLQYYNDQLFGVSHEIKMGVEYSTRRVTTVDTYPGNVWLDYNLNYPDFYGDEYTPGISLWTMYNKYNLDFGVKQLTAFLQDTITTGKLNILLGLRYDRQSPSINPISSATVDGNPVWDQYFDSDVQTALYNFLPGTQVPSITPNYHWNVWSPRIGVTYDLFGNGKTVLKLSGAMYGDFMGTGSASYLFNPRGAGWASTWMQFWWLPSDNTGKVHAGDLYFTDPYEDLAPYPLIVNGAVNPQFQDDAQFYWWDGTVGSTATQPSPYFVDPNATSSRTWELLASVDHELLPNFSAGLNFTYRKYNHFTWNPSYYTDGPFGDYSIDGQSVITDYNAYLPAGVIPSDFSYNSVDYSTGTGAGHTYYLLDSPFTGTPYALHTLNTNYETYWGVDLVFNKRLSNKWMLDGSLSYQDQKYHYGNGVGNPTNLWALNDQLYAPYIGGASGKISQYIFSHWQVKLEGLYQLPLGFDVSFTFNARAGHIIPQYMYINDYVWRADVNPVYYGVGTTYLDVFGQLKLPTFYQLNLRVEKMIKLFDTGRIYLMADFFNVTNAAIINRRYDQRIGTMYVYGKDEAGNITDFTFSPYSLNYVPNEVLNPFIARFGVRFQF